MQEENLRLTNELDEAKATAQASAATVELGYLDGNTVNITGTTTITSFGAARQAGVQRIVIFDGALTLTHGASLDLPGATDIVTVAGDTAVFVAETATAWKCASYSRADVSPVNPALLGAAPVDGVQSTVTVDMTNADADLTYTAVDYGTDGDDITVTHTDPSGNDQPLVVSVVGTAIDVSLATDGGGTITSTAALVKAAVNVHAEASLLVLCEDESAGAGITNAKTVESLANGVDVTAGGLLDYRINAAGTIIYFKVSAQIWKQMTLDALA